MNHKHADYKSAKLKLSRIFGVVTGSTKSEANLQSLLQHWLSEHASKEAQSGDEMILSFGARKDLAM